jgi:starvation-inducible DNA-binding protein
MASVTSKPNLTEGFYPTRIDLAADTRISVVKILNQTLASTLDLKTQTDIRYRLALEQAP